MKFSFVDSASHTLDAVVVGVYGDCVLTPQAEALDSKTNNLLTKSIKSSHFKGKKGTSLKIPTPTSLDCNRILLVGLGEKGTGTSKDFQDLGGRIFATVGKSPDDTLEIDLDGVTGEGLDSEGIAAHVAYGCLLRSWRFDKYKTKERDESIPSLNGVTLVTASPDTAEAQFRVLECVAEGVFLARELVSEPPNVLYPESYAERICALRDIGLEVEVLNEKQMQKLGMNALLGVGQGSIRESQLAIMKWQGAEDADEAPLAFVGKGVCFDTGGISIKPANGMEDMKYDMGGSAAVVGLMKALAGRKAKVNAIGVVGLVENMPGGNAQRPSDIVTTMSGQTVEVLNTDAEGRLVLCDALWYTQDKYKPQLMIDLATLTGAIVVSLGSEYAGSFSNDDEIADRLYACGNETGDKVWRFPLHKNYDRDMDSDVADIRNIGQGRGAGSITAAQYLQRFVNDVPWAHLDIAGTAWTKADLPTCGKGATGFGVQLLDRFVAKHYES